MRRAKIVATLGPASSDHRVIDGLVRCGVDVARLNFSHGTPEEHRKRIEALRSACRRLDRTVACLQDLSGPKIRTGPLVNDQGVRLETGATNMIKIHAF